jgi:hypothetical protein
MDKKECLHCGKKIMGRSDKSFCADRCRASYANQQKSEFNALRKKIHDRILKNRDILYRINPRGTIVIQRDILEYAGFDFSYFTNSYRNKKGELYWFCYDQGIRELPCGSLYQLVKRLPDL